MSKKERITLGSGKLYVALFAGTDPDIETICVDDNLLGLISGGATLEYKPTFYQAKDDLGYVMKEIITEEEVTLKAGILTFTGDTLGKLSSTARVSEDTEEKKRTVRIGGVGNRDGKSYAIVFHHEDKVDGDIWVCIVGTNQAGFSLSFAKDKETVIDAEFKAQPMDSDGTLIKYIEKDDTITAGVGG